MAEQKKQNYMDLIFLPNPAYPWKEDENGMVVIDIEHKGFFFVITQKLLKKPRVSHITLDAYGTKLWKSLDGRRNVYDVVLYMEEQFPQEKEQMINRVVTFLHTLQKNHFILAI